MMRYSIAAGVALVVTAQLASADNCAKGSQEIGGNWYCQPVQAIQYTGVGASDSYQNVISMNNGQCGTQAFPYKGALAPIDGELSVHFAGPLQLKQFGFYVPGGGAAPAAKARRAPSAHERRHGHQHFHDHDKEIREIQDDVVEKRDADAEITATINGKVVSWANPAGATPAAGAPAEDFVKPQTTGTASPGAQNSPNIGNAPTVHGDWVRDAYYDSKSQTAQGLTFLNHLGGSASGTWSASFGNSLSYAAPDGTTPAASSQILGDITIPSNNEVVIMTNKPCNGNDCGFVRPGSVNYHGFDGPSKIFVFEFQMPLDGKTGWNCDKPAIWLLNAKIPLVNQFPENPVCSCWNSGCGEFDIFEVLDAGNLKAKSTLHLGPKGSKQQAGDSDYFVRPTTSTIKVAVTLDGTASTAHIQILDNSVTFPTTLTNAQAAGFSSIESGPNFSLFQIPA